MSAIAASFLALLIACASAFASAAAAPEPLVEPAASLLHEAREAVAMAYGRDDPWTPDHPGWREGLALGRRALQSADHPDIHRFLGRTYALVGWSIRALLHFDALRASGASLDDPPGVVAPEFTSSALYASAAADLGFARYGLGDVDGAIDIYERWLNAVPGDLEAMRWLGRLHLERLDPLAALPYWERVAEAVDDDASVAYHLAEARRGAAVGAEASVAFREGITAYEAGERSAALERFEAAAAAAPTFADAAVWAGRTALELQQPVRAVQHWARAAELRPGDDRAAYFLRVARTQAEYGVAAGSSFHEGLTAYEQGQPDAALAALERAVAANDAFLEAWVWLARVRQELGHYDDAVAAWDRVLHLDPEDDRARYFRSIARQQRGVSAAAGAVFAEGIVAFEASDFATAEARFREAVALEPEAVPPWVWLGRVAFSLQRFEEAAAAFERAALLDPADADIAFFAAEAAALARGDEAEAEPAVEGEPEPVEGEPEPAEGLP